LMSSSSELATLRRMDDPNSDSGMYSSGRSGWQEAQINPLQALMESCDAAGGIHETFREAGRPGKSRARSMLMQRVQNP
jgi:hypothetical protein